MPLTFLARPAGEVAVRPAPPEDGDTVTGGRRPVPAIGSAVDTDVVLVTEGTYPHAHGGVSVWCDQLVTGLPETRFKVVALVAFGYQRPVWDLPPHARELVTVGLWDMQRSPGGRRQAATSPAAVQLARLLTAPHDDVDGFRGLVDGVAAATPGEAATCLGIGPVLRALDVAVRESRWPPLAGARVADLVEVAGMLDHLLRPLTVDPGPAPVYHASSNGLAALVCMVGRRRHGGRFLLTEHGIYLRERYLELRRSTMSRAARALLVRFHRLVTAAAYAEAALVAPGSRWNQRWELRYGADPARIRTIYNGIDPSGFPVRPDDAPEPVVSWLGRVDPIKDLDTLIRAFAVVHASRPGARLCLYGRTPAGNQDHRATLDALVHELGLDGVVTFEGGVAASADAYRDAQVGVLSSISEGFPYSLIEAMACGLPTVATGVGGVPEAVDEAGIVVLPRAPELLGRALGDLLADAPRRRKMGALARDRVVDLFTLDHCLAGYRAVYRQLGAAGAPTPAVPEPAPAVPGPGTGARGGAGDGVLGLEPPDGVGAVAPGPGPIGGAGEVVQEREDLGLTGDERDALVAAVGGAEALSEAVDAEEVAATLESVGVTDAVAAERFGARDVFDLAELAWDRLRSEPPSRPSMPPRAPTRWGEVLARGLAYVLPAGVVAAATVAGAPQDALVAASALGWGLAQGGGVLAYTVLHRSPSPTALAPLRRALAGVGLAVVVAGALVGALRSPAEGVAFALPLLHLLGSTALVMAERTRALFGLLAPVSALSAWTLVAPASGGAELVAPVAVATVAMTLARVGLAARGQRPPGPVLEPADWARAVPLVVGGWATAAFALLCVSSVGHMRAFHGIDSRQWLIVGLPLWVMVAGCECLLLAMRRSRVALLVGTSTLAAYRSAARWSVAAWLGVAVGALEVAVAAATRAAELPRGPALTAASLFFLVAVTLIGVTVLVAADRVTVASLPVGLAALLLAAVALTPRDLAGVGDHLVALAICLVTATGLCLVAAASLVDPVTHR